MAAGYRCKRRASSIPNAGHAGSGSRIRVDYQTAGARAADSALLACRGLLQLVFPRDDRGYVIFLVFSRGFLCRLADEAFIVEPPVGSALAASKPCSGGYDFAPDPEVGQNEMTVLAWRRRDVDRGYSSDGSTVL